MKGYTREGKFHPINPYNKVRKSRDQRLKTKGVRLKHVQRQILNPKGARQKYNQLFWDDLPTITRVLIIGDEIDIETSYLDLPPKQRNQVDSALEQKRLLDEVLQNPNKETMEAFKNKKSLKKRDSNDDSRRTVQWDTLTNKEKEKIFPLWALGRVLEVPNLKFKPVSNFTWEGIQDDGLAEEQDKFKKSDWKEAEFKISKKDSDGLKKMQGEQIEKYAVFDQQLKIKFGMKFTDLINYDEGYIIIVTAGVETMFSDVSDVEKKMQDEQIEKYYAKGVLSKNG